MHDFRLLMHPARIRVGQPVWSRGRVRAGTVGAVLGASLRVDLPSGDEFWLPVHIVSYAFPHGAVHLAIEREEIALRGTRPSTVSGREQSTAAVAQLRSA